MRNIENIKENIRNKNITILGAGISGKGASILADYLGANVLLSNNKQIKTLKSISDSITVEYSHSDNCLKSDLVIISPGIDIRKSSIIKKIIKHNIPIISEIEFGFWFTKSPVIAITGSNGKSTVVKLIYEIFHKKFKESMLGGNIGISFCENVYQELNNDWESTIHILELSSFQLQKTIKFKPDLSCLLNITKDHINRHGNFDNYFNDKLKIIQNLDNNSKIIYNKDDIILENYFKNSKYAISFSIKNKMNDFIINGEKIFCAKSKELIINQKDTNLIGKHNLSNIVAAIQISKLYNIDIDLIKNALIEFKPLKHRMETVKSNSNITFINDSKGTNLVSTSSAVESFDKNIILILGGFSEDKINKSDIEKLIKKNNIYMVVCYGQIGKKIYELIKNIKISYYKKSFSSAIKHAIKHSFNNSVVLLSPGFKSFDQFNSFEERGEKFKEIINHYYA